MTTDDQATTDAAAGSVLAEQLDRTDYPPVCTHCGRALLWEDCAQCDEGYTPPGLLHEVEPDWYDEDDVEPCDICDAKGGWWYCPDRQCRVERNRLERMTRQGVAP